MSNTPESDTELRLEVHAQVYAAAQKQVNAAYTGQTSPIVTAVNVDAIMQLIKQDRETAKIHAVSDLAWCLGKLRGLGHPNETMEKRHGFQEKQKGGEDE